MGVGFAEEFDKHSEPAVAHEKHSTQGAGPIIQPGEAPQGGEDEKQHQPFE